METQQPLETREINAEIDGFLELAKTKQLFPTLEENLAHHRRISYLISLHRKGETRISYNERRALGIHQNHLRNEIDRLGVETPVECKVESTRAKLGLPQIMQKGFTR